MLYGFYQKVNNVCMWTIQVSEGFVDCARVLFVTRGREIVAESEDSTTTNQSVAGRLLILRALSYCPEEPQGAGGEATGTRLDRAISP